MRISRCLKITCAIVSLFLIAVAVVGIWVAWVLNGSLARLEGDMLAPGLSDSSEIQRDANGIVTIIARTRNDIAYSLGWVHAQERFFQMDLLRRNSAGELSELFGSLATEFDSRIRRHQFRKRAAAVLEQLPKEHLALLQAYTKGVNQGLAQLNNPPFEYYLLRETPRPWHSEDTMLVVYSMYMDLQDEFAEGERALSAMRDFLPQDWFEFLIPQGGEWDAPIEGNAFTFKANVPEQALASFQTDIAENAQEKALVFSHPFKHEPGDDMEIGSNSWAVDGTLTAHGGALLANDMHLGLAVPNIWFRASWVLPDNGRRITGVTLPGAPLMVVGSTEKIAWAFTNSFGDYLDVVRLQVNQNGTQYLSPEGWQNFVSHQETIQVKGEEPRHQTVQLTQWGPVIGQDHHGNTLAMRWVAHDTDSVNLGMLGFERAATVFDVVDAAGTIGVPGQNLLVADSQGNIAWTIIGVLPQREGYDSLMAQRLIADWSQAGRGWRGKLPAAAYPRLVNPPNARLWTANARVVSGEKYRVVGDGLGALGARQQQIRDSLMQLKVSDETAFLTMQLDNRALFLQRWHEVLSALVNGANMKNDSRFDALRRALENWQGRANVSSVAYLLTQRFRKRFINNTLGEVLDYVATKTDTFHRSSIDNKLEYAAWALISQQPEQHIPQGFNSWQGFLEATVVKLQAEVQSASGRLDTATWGSYNRLAVRHPLSKALPLLGRWLDMPGEPMPGDAFMPRVQGRRFGASQRMAVSPGREKDGYLHMPVGQSGHPLSPFFATGHRDWVEGRPAAFLPGATMYRLRLRPQP